MGATVRRADWRTDLIAFAEALCRDCGWKLSLARRLAVVEEVAARYWPAPAKVLEGRKRVSVDFRRAPQPVRLEAMRALRQLAEMQPAGMELIDA
jgi:hypothetical protein